LGNAQAAVTDGLPNRAESQGVADLQHPGQCSHLANSSDRHQTPHPLLYQSAIAQFLYESFLDGMEHLETGTAQLQDFFYRGWYLINSFQQTIEIFF
jgi:hypothetical protein